MFAVMEVGVKSKQDWTLDGRLIYRKGAFYWITQDEEQSFMVRGEDGVERAYDKHRGDMNYYRRYFEIVPA